MFGVLAAHETAKGECGESMKPEIPTPFMNLADHTSYEKVTL